MTDDGMVPVFRPRLMGRLNHLHDTLESSWWGTGPKVAAFEAEFARFVGATAPRCLMLNSCTAALHLAMKMYPGRRRVLLPALTFISTGLAAYYERADIRFVEVGDDLCMDEQDALRKLRGESDVVIAVHLGGHVAKLDCLRKYGHVIEDCAHALGSYDEMGAHVGTKGIGCFSFQATKGLPIGDGGMLVVDAAEQRARVAAWSWCGIGQSTWQRSSAQYRWAYAIEDAGYKYRANDVAAALALDQWSGLEEAIEERQQTAKAYTSALVGLDWLRLPEARVDTRPNWQEYAVRTRYRDALQEHLAERGVATTVHYYPINLYPWLAGRQQLPFTEKVWREILTIPCFAGMTEQERERVVDGVRSFRP